MCPDPEDVDQTVPLPELFEQVLAEMREAEANVRAVISLPLIPEHPQPVR